jgi:hypothetical protein
MLNSNFEIILDESLVIDESPKNAWEKSKFKYMVKQSNDCRGSWGEGLVHKWCIAAGLSSKWDEDSNINCEDGVYDVVIDDQRVEVKTSFSLKNWQHENIYLLGDKFDKIVFVDVDPENIYLTVLDREILSPAASDRDYKILGKTPTLRGDQIDKYKFDFSRKSLQNGIEEGHTFVYNVENPDFEGLSEFLRNKFQRGA